MLYSPQIIGLRLVRQRQFKGWVKACERVGAEGTGEEGGKDGGEEERMDLLGGYGDDSDEEGGSPPQEAAKPASAGGLSSLMGYAHDSGDEDGGRAGGDGEGEGGGDGGKAGENGALSDVGPGPSSAGGNPSLSPSSSQANVFPQFPCLPLSLQTPPPFPLTLPSFPPSLPP